MTSAGRIPFSEPIESGRVKDAARATPVALPAKGCLALPMTANTRLKLGIALAVGGNLLFFTSAWIAWMPWPAAFKGTLWSILFFAPEAGTLAGAAIMGKENYIRFKDSVTAFFRRFKPKRKEPEPEPPHSDAGAGSD